MTAPNLLFALAALIPAMVAPAEGTPQLPAAGAIVVGLCNGGSMILPFGNGAPLPGTAACCCAKGCRNDDKRKRTGRKQ